MADNQKWGEFEVIGTERAIPTTLVFWEFSSIGCEVAKVSILDLRDEVEKSCDKGDFVINGFVFMGFIRFASEVYKHFLD